MFTRILVPLDGSSVAEQVLPYAKLFARTLALPVELLAVNDVSGLLTALEHARNLDYLVEDMTRKAGTYLDQVAEQFTDTQVQRTVVQGIVADVIIDNAAHDSATLIAMATHGRSGPKRWLLGSNAEKVLRATENPLLLVRAAEDVPIQGEATIKSIMVPLDGSPLAEAVLPLAVQLAEGIAAEIVLVRAYRNPYGPFTGGSGYYAATGEELMEEIHDEAHQYLDDKLAALKEQGVEAITFLLQEGDPVDEIVATAQEMPDTLIAMCSHGRSGVTRWVLGSVAETVVRHTEKPVLVLRTQKQRDSESSKAG